MNIRKRTFACGFAAFLAAYCMVAVRVPDEMVNCTLYANPSLRLVDFVMGIMAYRVIITCGEQMKRLLSGMDMLVANIVLLLVYWCCINLGVGVRCSAPFWVVSLKFGEQRKKWRFARLMRLR